MPRPLLECFESYQNAVAAHERRAAVDITSAAVLASADDVLMARLGLYACLIRCGWTPPEAVRFEIEQDASLAQEEDDRWLDSAPAAHWQLIGVQAVE